MKGSKSHKRKLTTHHRKPSSLCKNSKEANRPENLSRVPRVQHEAYHTLWSNATPQEIAEDLNLRWIDPNYEIVVRKKGGS